MNLNITFSVDNAAFEYQAGTRNSMLVRDTDAVAAILRRIASRIDAGEIAIAVGTVSRIHDLNGNNIGSVGVTE